MSTQRFETILVQSGAQVRMVLPFDPNQLWGVKLRHHVTGSVNGRMIRGPLMAEDDVYFLALGAAWRRDNGLSAGDSVEVILSPEGPQAVTLSPDIAAALDAEPQSKTFFESLATYYRKGFIGWIESAKRPETRRARIAEMVRLLKAGQKQG